jgi:hypothetical protein
MKYLLDTHALPILENMALISIDEKIPSLGVMTRR